MAIYSFKFIKDENGNETIQENLINSSDWQVPEGVIIPESYYRILEIEKDGATMMVVQGKRGETLSFFLKNKDGIFEFIELSDLYKINSDMKNPLEINLQADAFTLGNRLQVENRKALNGASIFYRESGDIYIGNYYGDFFEKIYVNDEGEVANNHTKEGRIIFSDESRYIGEWKKDAVRDKNGKVIMTQTLKTRTMSPFEVPTVVISLLPIILPHGTGKLIAKSGHQYEGEFQYGKFDGQGMMKSQGGDVYKGGFKQNKFHGYGILNKTNQYIFHGEYLNGEKQKGLCIFNNGNVYMGEFKNNKCHGDGEMKFQNGNKYKGGFKNGEMNGQGVLILANGTEYEGTFKDGKLNGFGVQKFLNGLKHRGNFTNGKFNGEVEIICNDQTRYKVDMINDTIASSYFTSKKPNGLSKKNTTPTVVLAVSTVEDDRICKKYQNVYGNQCKFIKIPPRFMSGNTQFVNDNMTSVINEIKNGDSLRVIFNSSSQGFAYTREALISLLKNILENGIKNITISCKTPNLTILKLLKETETVNCITDILGEHNAKLKVVAIDGINAQRSFNVMFDDSTVILNDNNVLTRGTFYYGYNLNDVNKLEAKYTSNAISVNGLGTIKQRLTGENERVNFTKEPSVIKTFGAETAVNFLS
jgi:hypothetical protein